jgi:hypothetical protein
MTDKEIIAREIVKVTDKQIDAKNPQPIAEIIADWILECIGQDKELHDGFEYGYNCHRMMCLKKFRGEKWG